MSVHCSDSTTEQMYLGEERWLTYKIVSCNPEPGDFTIQAASYSIPGFAADGGDVSGDCIVDNENKTIKVKVKPLKANAYTITFTLLIADETIKLKGIIHVCE